MTSTRALPDPTASAIAAERTRTARAQAQAADPTASAWVAANAGTGKTHVLTMRVLRLLLLEDARPERILCLTYTKAAAAEMSTRVFQRLAGWVIAAPEALARELADLLGRPPSPAEVDRARGLFAAAIETPGGLKVQTIHAFCERLLQRFPLEAGIPPGFAILDEETARQIRREAVDAVLAAATGDPSGPLGRAVDTMVTYAVEDGFDGVLRDALGRRAWLTAAARLASTDGDGADGGEDDDDPAAGFDGESDLDAAAVAAARGILAAALGVPAGADADVIEAEMADVLSDDDIARAITVLGAAKATDQEVAEALRGALTASSPAGRRAGLAAALLTKSGTPRADSRFPTKDVREAEPGLTATLRTARDRFADLTESRRAVAVAEASTALLQVALAVEQQVAAAKQARAALDFEDLIARTAILLNPSRMGAAGASSTEWVLFKLDGGLDHVLVDESQDTSPEQWAVIEALAREFFAGEGARETQRTVFAVGDEKQSIYSFQGARPEMFAATGATFAELAAASGRAFHHIPLTLSFRTVAAVLEGVDRVFADTAVTPGLSTAATPIVHTANRAGHAGLVELWPVEMAEDAEPGDAWSPLGETTRPTPVARLADRIADTIAHWLASGERLVSEDRPIRPGDIMVLVRRRRPFADAMVAALKRRGIPVAGTDRMRLMEQIAVQDLVALGDFLLLPDDDLALAAVLKSPLIGLDDDDLMRFAPGRSGALWAALVRAGESDARLAAAAQRIARWRRRADLEPPFELLARILDENAMAMRSQMLARLGPEAADALDELLERALAYDEGAAPSLQGFLGWLRDSEPEIKRDMEHGRNQVRVMTVHGSKGLEAPILFLPDTCSTRSGAGAGGLLALAGADRPLGVPPPVVWPVKGASGLAPVAEAKDAQSRAELEELNRLLYVAMTRARDRLYIAGYAGLRGPDAGSWYKLIEGALTEDLVSATSPLGFPVRRREMAQTAAPALRHEAPTDRAAPAELPEWARRPAPREPQLTVPLAPSRLAPLDSDGPDLDLDLDVGTASNSAPPPPLAQSALLSPSAPPPTTPPLMTTVPREPAAPSPRRPGAPDRFLRGTLTHALLEHLPGLPRASWGEAARGFVATRGAGLTARTRADIVAETLAVLTVPEFAALFGPDSRAEVPIAAEIAPPSGRGPALRLTGQIDRLAVTAQTVLIVDYKTNRPPPLDVAGVPEAYLLQLAAYRLALGRIYSDKIVRAAIVWTDGPRLMEIAAKTLDVYEQRLWALDTAQLDGTDGDSYVSH